MGLQGLFPGEAVEEGRGWLSVHLWSIRALLGMRRGNCFVEMMQDFCFIGGTSMSDVLTDRA